MKKLNRQFPLLMNSTDIYKESSLALDVIARGAALFFGVFGLANLLGESWRSGFDANLWWLDLRSLAPFASTAFVAVSCVCLVVFSLKAPRHRVARIALSLPLLFLTVIAAGNALNFYVLLAKGSIGSGLPVPISLFVAGACSLVLMQLWKNSHGSKNREIKGLALTLGVCCGCAVLFPLAQMFCFGKTDYRRQADVAVVFGARVYADGRPSDALADRVRTACRLYSQGLTQKLLFSGGPGDGAVHETESMKRMAVSLGVKPEDIILDKSGLNTEATVRNSKAIFQQLHPGRVLVVSHFYHLPRIKLAYQRAGIEVYTVPAKESYLLGQLPYNMAREVAALWVYYLKA